MNEYYQRANTYWRVNGLYVMRVINHGTSSEIKAGVNEFIMPDLMDDKTKLITKKEFEDELLYALSIFRAGPFGDLSRLIVLEP